MPVSGVELVSKVRASVDCLGPSEVLEFLATHPQALLLDVSESAEHEGAALPSAVNVPRGLLEFQITELCDQDDRPIVVHCVSGGRAVLAGRTLGDMGYTQVRVVTGSFADLQEQLGAT